MGDRPNYDMFDDEEDLQRYGSLQDVLATVREALWSKYEQADAGALRSQKYHRIMTLVAVLCGTVAVMFAVVHLSKLCCTAWPMWVEFLAVVVAIVAVVVGLREAWQSRWLLERHRAEGCRLLKFRALIHPLLWSGDDRRPWEQHVLREAQAIGTWTQSTLERWAEREEVVEIPPEIDHCRMADATLRDLVDYFQTKRLGEQIGYFARRAKRFRRFDRHLRDVPAVLFYCSVTAALVHFVLALMFKDFGKQPRWEVVSRFFVVTAAVVPAWGAAFRLLRSSREFARSASLFQAKEDALKDLNERLQKTLNGPDTGVSKCAAVLRILWQCEHFLEGEHREWLRLMLETEWFL